MLRRSGRRCIRRSRLTGLAITQVVRRLLLLRGWCWPPRFSLDAGLGAVDGRAASGPCLVGAYGSGRDLVNRSQGHAGSRADSGAWAGATGGNASRQRQEFPTGPKSSPWPRRFPNLPPISPQSPERGEGSPQWGTQSARRRLAEGVRRNAGWAPRGAVSARAETGRR